VIARRNSLVVKDKGTGAYPRKVVDNRRQSVLSAAGSSHMGDSDVCDEANRAVSEIWTAWKRMKTMDKEDATREKLRRKYGVSRLGATAMGIGGDDERSPRNGGNNTHNRNNSTAVAGGALNVWDNTHHGSGANGTGGWRHDGGGDMVPEQSIHSDDDSEADLEGQIYELSRRIAERVHSSSDKDPSHAEKAVSPSHLDIVHNLPLVERVWIKANEEKDGMDESEFSEFFSSILVDLDKVSISCIAAAER